MTLPLNCKKKAGRKFPKDFSRRKEGGLRLRGLKRNSYWETSSGIEFPLVSIITVVRNGEEHLEETIQHVLQQAYQNIEYIIIDGDSTDGTLDIIKKYDYAVDYWVSEGDRGIYDAMNKGISFSSGEILGIINSDDYYENDAVSLVVSTYKQNKDARIFFGDLFLINESVGLRERIIPRIDLITYANRMNHPTCFIHRSVYAEKKYSLAYSLLSDYDLLLFAYVKGFRFLYINQPLATMRVGGASDKFFLFQDFKIKLKYFGLFHAIRTNVPRQLARIAETWVRIILMIVFNRQTTFRILFRIRKLFGKSVPNRR